ncbi:MAG TPA: bifunctional nuclease family protein [Symbiobacteriaceae bacterium]|nr:bifunctional nuclease family protein [Symbiobacteriaceae bacterium]
MVRLELLNVGLVEETGGILLVMHDVEDERLLVIETGLLEGQAIALEAQGVRADRPLTQDLLHEVIVRLGARVKAVEIEDFEDEAFIATIVLHRVDGTISEVRIDARPSDAIALALRAEAPIFVADRLMAEHGIAEEREGRFAALFGRAGAEEEYGDDGGEGGGVVH